MRLERNLRAAQAVGACQLPALDRHQAVGGPGTQDQCVVFDHGVHALTGTAQLASGQVPGQGVGAVVDLRAQAIEAFMQVTRFGRFSAIQRRIIAFEAFWLTAIDLPAVTPVFVDQDRFDARSQQGFGAAGACRAGADDDHSGAARVANV